VIECLPSKLRARVQSLAPQNKQTESSMVVVRKWVEEEGELQSNHLMNTGFSLAYQPEQ
jgi:hypothetical protein